MSVTEVAEGYLVRTSAYRLQLAADSPVGRLEDADGRSIGLLAFLANVDTTSGLDGADDVARVRLEESIGVEDVFVVDVSSTRWQTKRIMLRCRPDEVAVNVEVEGRGELADVTLLGGRHPGSARWGSGTHLSRLDAATLFSPNPANPRSIARDPERPVVIGVRGGAGPGIGHWFFTPPPLCLAVTTSSAPDPLNLPPGPWTLLGVVAALPELTFTEMRYEPIDGGFAIALAYEGQTRVDGRWRSPTIVIRPGASDPIAAVAEYSRRLDPVGPPATEPNPRPTWWSEPIFCGWGAQSHLASLGGGDARDHARQATYDRFLEALDERGIDPGTIVIDDRWQRRYGTGEIDEERWPDLPGWIEERHREGRRVLLWWKAWDHDGVPADLCVTTRGGRPIGVDPSNPAYRDVLARHIERLLAPPPVGVGADGLKIDFTARTPAGPNLRRHGPEWGIALLHRLLETIYRAAKAARPDAFIVAHAPNPAFADVADAIRLNDILRLDDRDHALVDVVAQMRYRAALARAACPGLLIETDDWCLPDRAAWRAYAAVKSQLGIPSLYYTTHLDLSGEPLTDADADLVRSTWEAYRSAREEGLVAPCR